MIDDFFSVVGYVLASKNRKLVLEGLQESAGTSAEIATKQDMPQRSVAKAVNELKKVGLVEPITENGRKYKITTDGLEVIESIQDRRTR